MIIFYYNIGEIPTKNEPVLLFVSSYRVDLI